jgi:hypothetical protein
MHSDIIDDVQQYEQLLKEAMLIFNYAGQMTNEDSPYVFTMLKELKTRCPQNKIYRSLYRQRGHLSNRQKSLVRKLYNEASFKDLLKNPITLNNQ